MLANHVDEVKAEIMYGAVYWKGPRWERKVESTVAASAARTEMTRLSAAALRGETAEVGVYAAAGPETTVFARYRPIQPTVTDEQLNQLRHAIETRKLTIEQIENYFPTPQNPIPR
jgi:hypothetical protein